MLLKKSGLVLASLFAASLASTLIVGCGDDDEQPGTSAGAGGSAGC